MTPLECWEAAVRERWREAALFGPPAWLVRERAGSNQQKDLEPAHVALRREYGLGDMPPRMGRRT